jgi:hypothetical protein
MCHRKGRTTFAAQGKLAMAVFFCCFEKGQDAWLTPGQEAGLISPRITHDEGSQV